MTEQVWVESDLKKMQCKTDRPLCNIRFSFNAPNIFTQFQPNNLYKISIISVVQQIPNKSCSICIHSIHKMYYVHFL